MKHQALFSLKDESTKIKVLSAAVLFGALRVKPIPSDKQLDQGGLCVLKNREKYPRISLKHSKRTSVHWNGSIYPIALRKAKILAFLSAVG